jgi:hypothetical protein
MKPSSKSTLSLFTLSLFLILSCSPVTRMIQEEPVTSWEKDIRVFDSLNLVELADTHTLLVAGSSSVRLWNTIHEDLAPYQVMQRGYGGAKLTDFNFYEERIIQPGTLKGILVFVANDISGGEHDRTPEEVLQLFKAMVKKIRSRNPDTPVFWIEITPTPSRWHVIDQIREANDLISHYCDKKKYLNFIRTSDVYINGMGLPDSTLFRDDMLHLNRHGYELWAERIRLNLEEAGIQPDQP